jgi:catecholate siderophore receptor
METKNKGRQLPSLAGLLPLGAALTGMTLTTCALAQSAADGVETTLPSVNVRSDRDKEEKGYQPGITNTTKLPLLPRDIPASITTVPQQLMYDRSADTFREALRNVPGLTYNAGEGGRIGDNITLRGYSVVGDIYLDGIRDIAQYNRDLFNIESIDVLRGSASMLFGRGSTGGIINQVSKQPVLYDRYEASLTAGSYKYFRETADLNKKIGDSSAIRLNLMRTDADSFRDGVESHRWGFAPTIAWGIGGRNEVSLSWYHLQYNDVPDYGVPYFQGRPLAVPVNRFYGLTNADSQRDSADVGTATYIHRWTDDTSLKTVLRKGRYSRDLWAVAPRLIGAPSVITDSTPINRQAQRRAGDEDTTTSQTDFTTKFATGRVKHLVLAGVELMREKAQRWNWVGGGANPPTTVGNINSSPDLPPNFFSVTRGGQVNYTADTVGLYGQDMLELTSQWKLLLGGRWDHFKADYERAAPQGPLARTDRVWSYRTGLIYQPSDFQSYYVAYGTSFNPSGELYSLDDRSANTPPEKNRNIEAGAKWELADGDLSLRTAVFRSEKTNERNTDLAVTVEQNLLAGKRHTDGIELEAAGRILPQWEVFSGLALMKSEIDAATGQQLNTLGKKPINTPSYTFNVWTTYKLGGGWKVGTGVEGVGNRYGNTTNTVLVPHYARWDALLAYEQRRYDLKLNILNLANESYYEGVYQGHVVPGVKRTVLLTAKLKY